MIRLTPDIMAADPRAIRLLKADLPTVTIPPTATTGPVPSELSRLVSDTLRRGLIGRYFASLNAESDLRNDVRAVCSEARRQGMRVEYLIIAFKDAWRRLPEARMLPQGSQGSEFLSRVITLTISEFFSPGRGD